MRLFGLFFVSILFLLGCSVEEQPIHFSDKEREYLRSEEILVAVEDNFKPYIFIDKGIPSGIATDYIDIISKKSGLNISFEKSFCQLLECFNRLKNGQVSIVTSVRPTPGRAKDFYFSRPFIFVGSVLVTRVGEPKTVGIGKGFAIKGYLEIERKDLKIIEFNNDEDSILALLAGEIDSVALDEGSEILLRKKYKFPYTSYTLPHDYPLSFAVNKDNVTLVSILDKVISAVSAEDQERIKKKWR